MNRLLVGILAMSLVLVGCSKTEEQSSATWVAFQENGKPTVYYDLGGPKTAKVGKLLETFTPKKTRQGSWGWSTNMKFSTPISIYTILGVDSSQEVAVKLSNDGIYDVAIAHQ